MSTGAPWGARVTGAEMSSFENRTQPVAGGIADQLGSVGAMERPLGASSTTTWLATDLSRTSPNRGDRLVFSNGILALSAMAGVLIVVFQAEVSALIPLYAVGVFTGFTLSQSA